MAVIFDDNFILKPPTRLDPSARATDTSQMARPPLLTLTDISLTFGGNPLFDKLSLSIEEGDRTALVGRNGSGKSTLMKIMAGIVQADSGTVFKQPGLNVGYMEQEPDISGFDTLGDYAESGLDPSEAYKIMPVFEGLKIDPATKPENASGGERRRAALARLIASDADLMLLDEPTNHLDISAILWLEDYLKATRKAFVLISHDRAFLSALTRATLWVDRGQTRRRERGFAEFEEWRDKIFEEEDAQRHKLDRLIKREGKWAVEGISARRTRNQGRVRRLAELRATRSAQIKRAGAAKMELADAAPSGKRVIEARDISHAFGATRIVEDFEIKIHRGDRVAFVGPNGVGKTTLLKILTGEIEPGAGSVNMGTNLEVGTFDQNRSKLDLTSTLWENLTGSPELGVSGRNDQIMVRGTPKHVVGYLKEFLFDDKQARGPVASLSGGERARLLLARIMARESNLLVLDEPTNDLDVETLDLLQEIIDDYQGTVLIVSHDRDFLDRVASTTIAMEGDGRATIYAGGWSDYLEQRGDAAPMAVKTKAKAKVQRAAPVTQVSGGLSNKERARLDKLPGEISRLEAEIAKLTEFLADPELFAKSPVKFQKASEGLTERQEALARAETEWLELEEKAG